MNVKSEADSILASEGTKKEKIIKLCNLVRDIPYKRIGRLEPEDMIKEGKGSCTPKHVFLASYLKKIGVPLKFLFTPFYYKKLSLKYPRENMDIVENMPIAYHTALKAEIDGKWRIIDVTWDLPLKSLGFAVNEGWGGDSDMKLGVVPEETIEKDVDPSMYEKEKIKQFSENEIRARNKFYNLLGGMIESLRNQNL